MFAEKSEYARVITSNIHSTIIEFEMDDFQLIPVITNQTNMSNRYLVKFKEGASLLKQGAPDIHKYSRSIIIPDGAKMNIAMKCGLKVHAK